VFVLLQVDEEGYVLQAEFANAVSDLYTEESLNTLAQSKVPGCVTKGNEKSKGRYKVQQF
jgi:hypothetical protein